MLREALVPLLFSVTVAPPIGRFWRSVIVPLIDDVPVCAHVDTLTSIKTIEARMKFLFTADQRMGCSFRITAMWDIEKFSG
jgi:hypothetical protein